MSKALELLSAGAEYHEFVRKGIVASISNRTQRLTRTHA